MVTRKDVAKRAGVSPAVVSYVINNSNYVSQEKREAVLKAIKELHYTPNNVAKSLKTSRTFHFALVGDDVRNEFYTELVYYMEKILYQQGYSISLSSNRKEETFLSSLVNCQYDGIFLASNCYDVEQINFLAARVGALVFFQTKKYEGLDPRVAIVTANYYEGTREATRHLIDKGHRRIAYIPPYRSILKLRNYRDFRLMGYLDTLHDAGYAVDENLICTDTKDKETVFAFVASQLEKERAQQPTALLIGNDYLAAQVIQFLKQRNVSVPDDLAIVGMDNTNSSRICTPTLTTVEVPSEIIAQKVSKALIDILKGKKSENVFVPTKLIVREST
jgi:DNA-binding LacI/PurR family transcriptional regulator